MSVNLLDRFLKQLLLILPEKCSVIEYSEVKWALKFSSKGKLEMI